MTFQQKKWVIICQKKQVFSFSPSQSSIMPMTTYKKFICQYGKKIWIHFSINHLDYKGGQNSCKKMVALVNKVLDWRQVLYQMNSLIGLLWKSSVFIDIGNQRLQDMNSVDNIKNWNNGWIIGSRISLTLAMHAKAKAILVR